MSNLEVLPTRTCEVLQVRERGIQYIRALLRLL